MRVLLCILLCLASAACAGSRQAPISAPSEVAVAGRLYFSAWYTTKELDVPMQGVLRCVPGTKSALRAERMGLVLAQGRTVGVSQWDTDGVRRQPADMPGADRLLRAVEQAVVTLAAQRGIEISGDHVESTTSPDCIALAQDANGPIELRCGPPSALVTVRIRAF